MLGNCFGWMTYSVLRQNLWVLFGNAPGFCFAVWLNLQASKLQYESFRSQELRKSIVREIIQNRQSTALAASAPDNGEETIAKLVARVVPEKKVAPAPHDVLVLLNVVVWLAIVALISFTSAFSDRTNELIVGIAVNLNLVVFYGAPLSTIWTVLSTRDSASIHVPTMLTNTFNGCFWGIYGVAILDFFLAVPNLLGAGLGVVQIVLCVLFPRENAQGNSDETGPVESAAAVDVETPSKVSSLVETETNHTAVEEMR